MEPWTSPTRPPMPVFAYFLPAEKVGRPEAKYPVPRRRGAEIGIPVFYLGEEDFALRGEFLFGVEKEPKDAQGSGPEEISAKGLASSPMPLPPENPVPERETSILRPFGAGGVQS